MLNRVTEYLTARLRPIGPAGPAVLYDLLRDYYDNNDLYNDLARQMYAVALWTPAMEPIKNPTYRTVEFYASHLWPGVLPKALPIKTDNDRLAEPIQQVWNWSNLSAKKQAGARLFAMLGDMVIKVAQRPDGSRVYQQFLDPKYLTDYDVDERGFITWARLDFPKTKRNGPTLTAYTYTEIWSKADQTLKIYEHEKGAGAEVKDMGPAKVSPLEKMGIDFVPIVITPFRDVGADRGSAAILHAIDKIDKLNLAATRLHQMLFKYEELWALRANAETEDGRPLPPPTFRGARTSGGVDVVTIGGRKFIALPGLATIESLIPNLDFNALLAVVQDQAKEVEMDLPELTYYRVADMGELSGLAIQRLLGAAIKRVEESRGNAEAALIRADQMAISIGQAAGLDGFDVGAFEDGDLEHTFEPREVIPIAEMEIMAAIKTATEAGIPLAIVLKRFGWSADDIAAVEAAKEKDRAADAAGLAQVLLAQKRAADQNLNTPPLMDTRLNRSNGSNPGQPVPANGNGAVPAAAG